MKPINLTLALLAILLPMTGKSLASGDVSVKLISGYYWMDNSCTVAGPKGKVVSFRIINTKGSIIKNLMVDLTTITFVATGGISYTSGTPSFLCRTPTKLFLGDVAAGDSVTAFYFIGYNCLMYPNNTNITTDYLTTGIQVSDNNSGVVNTSFNRNIYVLRNSNNNTITILATSTNTIGTIMTLSVAYNISNVKPGNIIDMELSTLSTFPAGYSIMGCKITATTIPSDFPVNMTNTHYSNSITSNLPSGGSATIEWYLKITSTSTGITSSNITPFIVSDAGSSQRWQANTTTFTGTSVPTNPITMTKRASRSVLLTDDTLTYTIVLRNSSTTTDVTIDRLVDNLPRDYTFRYIETNVSVFPRLVTYANSSGYPDYSDTNYLYFNGNKPISSGVFSYLVPKQDSIKLIYSVKVSSIVSLSDTNFVSAYVGSSEVANAFAKVRLLSLLPIKIVNYKATSVNETNTVVWTAHTPQAGDKFELYKLNSNSEHMQYLNEWTISEAQDAMYFSYNDQSTTSNSVYVLKCHSIDGKTSEYVTEILNDVDNPFKCYFDNGGIHILYNNDSPTPINLVLTDAKGATILNSEFTIQNGNAYLPIDFNLISSGAYFIQINRPNQVFTTKIIN